MDDLSDTAASGLTHVDASGAARMVDVGDKEQTVRVAVASSRVRTRADVIALISDGAVAKGDVLATARIAGIMAAKRTSEIIPLCHPLALESVQVDLTLGTETVEILATVRLTGKTGVEMEALTAATAAALTVYDMCKAVDRSMVIEQVRLEEKNGGKSGTFSRTASGKCEDKNA